MLIAALVFFMVGGSAYVLEPGPWIGLATLGAIVAVLRWAGHAPRETLLIALPTFVAGWAAIAAGADDYLPWATSPLVWAGLAVSGAVGALLVQTRRLPRMEVLRGVLFGLVSFGVALWAFFVALTVGVVAL